MDNWRKDGQYPGLIVRISEKDFSRVGACWMNGRLKEGDLAMVISHSGDCFWNYMLVNDSYTSSDGKKLYRLIKESMFGAYTLGTPHTVQPSERESQLLMAGEYVPFE